MGKGTAAAAAQRWSALAPAILLLLACAGPARAEDRTGVTGDAIKIGIFQPLTGPATIFGYPVADGVIALYKEVNDQGGINGRKIEVVLEDDACSNAKTVAAVKKLIFRDRVFMLHGATCSAGALAAKPDIVASETPYVVMGATVDAIATPASKTIFSTILPSSQEGVMIANFINEMPGKHRIAIVKHADEWADSRYDPLVKIFKDSGHEIVANVQLDRGAVDATAQILQVKQANPDATVGLLYPAEVALLLRDAQKLGLNGPFVFPTSGQDILDTARRVGNEEALAEIYAISQMRGPPRDPSMARYEKLILHYFPNEKIQQFSFLGISGATLVIDALKRAGRELSREKLLAALESTKDLDAGAADCRISFTPTDHQACKTGTWLTFRNGKVVVVGLHWRQIH
jgi:branched-chain amino acid transport system substrate-binding protein